MFVRPVPVRARTAMYATRVRAFNRVRLCVCERVCNFGVCVCVYTRARARVWTAKYLPRVRTHTRTHERLPGWTFSGFLSNLLVKV